MFGSQQSTPPSATPPLRQPSQAAGRIDASQTAVSSAALPSIPEETLSQSNIDPIGTNVAPAAAASSYASSALRANLAPIIPTVVAPPPARSAELNQFTRLSRTQQLYHDAVSSYLTLTQSLNLARIAFEALKTKCNAKSPILTLPSSLTRHVDFAKLCRVPRIEGEPAHFASELKELHDLTASTTKSIYSILVKVNEKHLAHLASKTSVPAFILQQKSEFEKHVQQTFDLLDSVHQPPPAAASSASAAPRSSSDRAQAVIDFENHLKLKISDHLIVMAEKERVRLEKAAADSLALASTEERLFAGSKDGTSMEAIANRATDRQLAPIRTQLEQLSRKPHRLSHSDSSSTEMDYESYDTTYELHPSFFIRPPASKNSHKRKERNTSSKSSSTIEPSSPFDHGGEPFNTHPKHRQPRQPRNDRGSDGSTTQRR